MMPLSLGLHSRSMDSRHDDGVMWRLLPRSTRHRCHTRASHMVHWAYVIGGHRYDVAISDWHLERILLAAIVVPREPADVRAAEMIPWRWPRSEAGRR